MSTPISASGTLACKALDLLLAPLILTIILAAIWEAFDTHTLLLIATPVYFARNYFGGELRSHAVNLLDVSVLFLALSEIVSVLGATYQANSLPRVGEALSLLLFFYLIRFGLKRDYQRAILFSSLSLLAFCVSFGAVFMFFMQLGRLEALGFADPTDFRHTFSLFNPTGAPVGDWMTIFITLLPFPLITFLRFKSLGLERWLLLLPFLTTLAAALVTFSRGVYVAVAVFGVTASALFWVYKVAPWKRILFFNLGVLLVLSLALSLTSLLRPALTTLALFNTTSQVRSFDGRLGVWKQSAGIIRDHPWLGVGPNNFAMQYVSHKSPDAEAVFVGRAFNSFLQILIERGVLGLTAHLLLLVAFLNVARARCRAAGAATYRKAVPLLFVATYAAVVVRELSYSSMLTNQGVAVLLWLMTAYMARDEESEGRNAPTAYSMTLARPALATLLTVALAALAWASERGRTQGEAETAFRSFALHLSREEYEEAGAEVERSVALAPENAYYLAGQALLHERMVRSRVPPSQLREAAATLGEGDLAHVRAAAALYRRALELNPNDDGFYHNLGWLCWYLGQPRQAEENLRKAIEIDGTIALYHVSMGLLSEYVREPEQARREYSLALQLSPRLLDSRFFADLARSSPEEAAAISAEAAASLERRLQAGHSPLIKAKLGRLYLDRDSPERAAALLTQAAEDLPSLPYPWLHLGRLYEASEDQTAARQYYARAVFLGGSEALPWWRAGEYHYGRNQMPDALRCYRGAVEAWLRQSSEHAQRAFRVYRSRVIVADDVIPRGLLSYVGPDLNMAATALRLSSLYGEAGDEGQAEYFGALSAKFSEGR